METIKLSKSKKISGKIDKLLEKKKYINENYELNNFQLESLACKGAVLRRKIEDARNIIEIAKEGLYEIIKDKLILDKRNINFEKDYKCIKKDINVLNLEMMVAAYDENKSIILKEEKRHVKRGKSLEPILNKISLLPNDIIIMIHGFVSYDIKTILLEFKMNTQTLLNSLSLACLNTFLKKMCSTREFLSFVSKNEAISQINILNYNINLNYNPFWNASSRKETIYKIRHIINLAKEKNAKFAYYWLSIFHIIIDPKKKYKKSLINKTHIPKLTVDYLPSYYLDLDTDTVLDTI